MIDIRMVTYIAVLFTCLVFLLIFFLRDYSRIIWHYFEVGIFWSALFMIICGSIIWLYVFMMLALGYADPLQVMGIQYGH